jgi:hypothetical protein
MGSIPANPSTKHALCFPPSSMPASIEISIKLIVCLIQVYTRFGVGLHLVYSLHLPVEIAKFDAASDFKLDRDRDCGRFVHRDCRLTT